MTTIKVKPGTPRKLDDSDNPTFDQWMERIDKIIWHCLFLSIHDLPDINFMDLYEKRTRPIWAAKKAARYAGAEE
jgi:hypothetical protein